MISVYFLLDFGCSLFSRSQQTNHSASPVKRYLRWVSWQTFQIVAVWNICAFLMSMASLYSLSPGFHPSSASLSSPESLRNCTMMPQSSKGDRSNLHVGLWPPHPLADGIHARRTFLSGQACFRFWRRWISFPSPPILKARLPLSPSHMAMPFSSQVCHPLCPKILQLKLWNLVPCRHR